MEQNKSIKRNILSEKIDSLSTNYLFLSFFIPFIGMIMVHVIQSFCMSLDDPRAIFSTLKYDGYNQYFPFFKSFRQILLNGESLLWNWNMGMGIDYLGLIGYYLVSPFNWISVIIPESWLIIYFSFANVCRISLAGLFFAIMLKKLFNQNDMSIALFGSFYATCAWCFSYMWNTIWMDTFALLPLVVLGTINILKERKFTLYVIALALSLMINYYIGFFVCIFTLLTFCVYEICKWGGVKKLVADFGVMGVFTIIAFGLSTIILVPVLAQLATTQSSDASFPELLEINKKLLGEDVVGHIYAFSSKVLSIFALDKDNSPIIYDSLTFIVSVLIGMVKSATNCLAMQTLHDIDKAGLPNVYCGVFAFILTIVVLTSTSVPKRQRIIGIVLLLFFNLSFSCRAIDFVWHGLHFPNSIPYRYSFLYSFLLLVVAYKGWLMRSELKLKQIFISTILAAVAMIVHLCLFVDDVNLSYIAVNIALVIIYTAVLCMPIIKKNAEDGTISLMTRKIVKSIGSVTLTSVILVELIFNLLNCAFKYIPANVYEYPRHGEELQIMMENVEKENEGLLYYRIEIQNKHRQTLNDTVLHGYPGVSLFSSTANASVTKFAKKLGLQANPLQNRYNYTIGSPITNMFLNLKYVLVDMPVDQQYYECVETIEGVSLMQNNYYLPLGFVVDNSLATLSFDGDENPFDFQNKFISSAIGYEVAPFSLLVEDSKKIEQSVNFETNEPQSTIQFQYTANENGAFCFYFDIPAIDDMIVRYTSGDTHNSVYYNLLMCAGMEAVCQVKKGDSVMVEIINTKENPEDVKIVGAILNNNVVDEAYDVLSQTTMTLTQFENTFVEGVVNCDKDGLLYTSIPYNKNWTVYVDGVETEVSLIGNAMIGLELTKGEHCISFEYYNSSVVVGCIVSACSVLIFATICLVLRYRKKRME